MRLEIVRPVAEDESMTTTAFPADRIWNGRPIAVHVHHKAIKRNDTGVWQLVIKVGYTVQHLDLDVDGRADRDAAQIVADRHLAACGVTAA